MTVPNAISLKGNDSLQINIYILQNSSKIQVLSKMTKSTSLKSNVLQFLMFMFCFIIFQGPRDVKTFVDLLSISAGESDYEADRVSCLHTCCVVFEPIIFHLDETSGPEEIISACETIRNSLERDPDILNKLVS